MSPLPRLKLGLLSPHNPYDRRSFSGTAFFATKALRRHPGLDIRILGNHRSPRWFDRLFQTSAAAQMPTKADLADLDLVVGLVATPMLDQLASQTPGLPFIHVTDATPAFLREEYGWGVPEAADHAERRVVSRAARTVYSSEVVAARAGQDLGLPGLTPDIIPFGINLERMPRHNPRKPPLNRLNLVFIGLDWVRKGGDIAVAALEQLRREGQRAQLTVIGRCPPRIAQLPHVRDLGFLNKNRPRDMALFNRALSQAHLLLLPTRGDCTPMVLGEAMAHGTPVIATDTGGVSSVLGGTGQIMPPHASPTDWAHAIAELTAGRDRYQMLSDAAFDRAQTGLSWGKWSDAITELAQAALTTGQERDLKVAIGR